MGDFNSFCGSDARTEPVRADLAPLIGGFVAVQWGWRAAFLGGYLADRFAGTYGRSYPLVCSVGGLLAAIFFFVTFTVEIWYVAAIGLAVANFATDLKNGPNLAAAQNMAPPHMRPTAAAVIMIALVVLGAGMGPLIVGAISDVVAAGMFPERLGSFSAMCPGDRPLAGGTAELASACAAASADGLRGGLMVPSASFFLASIFFLWSALSVRRPLA